MAVPSTPARSVPAWSSIRWVLAVLALVITLAVLLDLIHDVRVGYGIALILAIAAAAL